MARSTITAAGRSALWLSAVVVWSASCVGACTGDVDAGGDFDAGPVVDSGMVECVRAEATGLGRIPSGEVAVVTDAAASATFEKIDGGVRCRIQLLDGGPGRWEPVLFGATGPVDAFTGTLSYENYGRDPAQLEVVNDVGCPLIMVQRIGTAADGAVRAPFHSTFTVRSIPDAGVCGTPTLVKAPAQPGILFEDAGVVWFDARELATFDNGCGTYEVFSAFAEENIWCDVCSEFGPFEMSAWLLRVAGD